MQSSPSVRRLLKERILQSSGLGDALSVMRSLRPRHGSEDTIVDNISRDIELNSVNKRGRRSSLLIAETGAAGR